MKIERPVVVLSEIEAAAIHDIKKRMNFRQAMLLWEKRIFQGKSWCLNKLTIEQFSAAWFDGTEVKVEIIKNKISGINVPIAIFEEIHMAEEGE